MKNTDTSSTVLRWIMCEHKTLKDLPTLSDPEPRMSCMNPRDEVHWSWKANREWSWPYWW